MKIDKILPIRALTGIFLKQKQIFKLLCFQKVGWVRTHVLMWPSTSAHRASKIPAIQIQFAVAVIEAADTKKDPTNCFY